MIRKDVDLEAAILPGGIGELEALAARAQMSITSSRTGRASSKTR